MAGPMPAIMTRSSGTHAMVAMMKLNKVAVVALRAVTSVGLIAIALVIFTILARSKTVLPTVDPAQLAKRVNVFTAKRIDVRRQWIGYGTAEAIDSANIPARVTATVQEVPPDILEGAFVHRDQVIARLDDSDFANQLNSAEQGIAGVDAMIEELSRQEAALNKRLKVETDDLALARDELDRVRKMFDRNAANQKDMDAAEHAELASQRNLIQVEQSLSEIEPKREQLKAQRAELASSSDTAKLNVERCTIRSPIDGVLQTVDVEAGESVAPGQQVARVVNLDKVQAPISMPAQARPSLRVGDEAELVSTARPGLTWHATVKRIAPEDDPKTRTFAAYVELNQPGTTEGDDDSAQPPLMPGVFVRGTLTASQVEHRIVVPRRSIRVERVMVVQDGEVEGQAVKQLVSRKVHEAYALDGPQPELGLPDEQWSVLDSGIEPGDVVVLTPRRSLNDGQVIEPIDATQTVDGESAAAPHDTSDQDMPGGGDR